MTRMNLSYNLAILTHRMYGKDVVHFDWHSLDLIEYRTQTIHKCHRF